MQTEVPFLLVGRAKPASEELSVPLTTPCSTHSAGAMPTQLWDKLLQGATPVYGRKKFIAHCNTERPRTGWRRTAS